MPVDPKYVNSKMTLVHGKKYNNRVVEENFARITAAIPAVTSPVFYASLTGAGETTTPGTLTQAGELTVTQASGSVTHLTDSNYIYGTIQTVIAAGTPTIAPPTQVALNPAKLQLFSGVDIISMGSAGVPGILIAAGPTDLLGFYGHNPVARPATPVTLADVIAALQALGLVS